MSSKTDSATTIDKPKKRKAAGEKKYFCTLCEKRFTQKRNLDSHLLIHANKRPFECTECDKKFTQRGILNEHIRTHSGEKPFVCPTCSKSFSQKKYLRTHMQIHTGAKPYDCPVCKKSFKFKTGMDMHRKTHDSGREQECQTCQKKILGKGNLTKHMMRVHSNEKAYICVTCHQRFFNNNDIIDHFSEHEGETSFICLICKQAFIKSEFKTHLETHGVQRASLLEESSEETKPDLEQMDSVKDESGLIICYNGTKKNNIPYTLDADVKNEIDEDIKPNKSELLLETPIIIKQEVKTEDFSDEETPTYSNLDLNLKPEPLDSDAPTSDNLCDESLIKDESELLSPQVME